MTHSLREEFQRYLDAGHRARRAQAWEQALAHFEAAHILGQSSTWLHVRSHLAMLHWGWASRNRREVAGQISRLLGATLFTWAWVPKGNPGSTRVSAFSVHPVPPDLVPWLTPLRRPL